MEKPLTVMACLNSPWSTRMAMSLTGAMTEPAWLVLSLKPMSAFKLLEACILCSWATAAMSGMGAIDPQVFAQHGDAKLRVWFSDGVNGFQQLSPDRHFASVPYAFSAGSATIADGSLSAGKLASNTITTTQLNEQILKYLKPEITFNRRLPD